MLGGQVVSCCEVSAHRIVLADFVSELLMQLQGNLPDAIVAFVVLHYANDSL